MAVFLNANEHAVINEPKYLRQTARLSPKMNLPFEWRQAYAYLRPYPTAETVQNTRKTAQPWSQDDSESEEFERILDPRDGPFLDESVLLLPPPEKGLRHLL
jgi:hypothetical protein